VSFGSGSYGFGSHVALHSFLSQTVVLKEKIISFRTTSLCAWLTMDLSFGGVYHSSLCKGIRGSLYIDCS
jgi:hypothetical protein